MNGGFGLVLDGSESAAGRARSMLGWDVSNGVARLKPVIGVDNINCFTITKVKIMLSWNVRKGVASWDYFH